MMEKEIYYIVKVRDKDGSEKYIARKITHSELTENIADALFIDINHETFKEYSKGRIRGDYDGIRTGTDQGIADTENMDIGS